MGTAGAGKIRIVPFEMLQKLPHNFSVLKADDEIKVRRRIFLTLKTLIYE